MSRTNIRNSKSFFASLGSLYSSGRHSDVTLVVEGKKIPAHRLILAFQSEYFDTLLFNDSFKESKMKEIPIEAPLKAFEDLMTFMYTAKAPPLEAKCEAHFELFDLSRMFSVQSLESILMEYFLTNINELNIVSLFDLSVKYDLKELGEKCLNWINKSMFRILKTDFIKEMSLNTFKAVLKSDLRVKTMTKFLALQEWQEFNPDCTDSDKKELAGLIDVAEFSNQEIIQILGPSGIFEKSFLFDVLMSRKDEKNEGLTQMRH